MQRIRCVVVFLTGGRACLLSSFRPLHGHNRQQARRCQQRSINAFKHRGAIGSPPNKRVRSPVQPCAPLSIDLRPWNLCEAPVLPRMFRNSSLKPHCMCGASEAQHLHANRKSFPSQVRCVASTWRLGSLSLRPEPSNGLRAIKTALPNKGCFHVFNHRIHNT